MKAAEPGRRSRAWSMAWPEMIIVSKSAPVHGWLGDARVGLVAGIVGTVVDEYVPLPRAICCVVVETDRKQSRSRRGTLSRSRVRHHHVGRWFAWSPAPSARVGVRRKKPRPQRRRHPICRSTRYASRRLWRAESSMGLAWWRGMPNERRRRPAADGAGGARFEPLGHETSPPTWKRGPLGPGSKCS